MKYTQQLIDKIWDLSNADMSVGKIAKMQSLKNEQVPSRAILVSHFR